MNDYLIDARIVVDNESDYTIEDVIEAKKQILYTESCIMKATELLEEEKQMVMQSYSDGIGNGMSQPDELKYFTETYER